MEKLTLNNSLKETFKNGRFCIIDADKTYPKNFKELLGFLVCNKGRDCFSKFQGNVWMISKQGNWVKVCRNIPDLTFNEYLKLSQE